MCGTAVLKNSSTTIRPRLSAVRPAASRLSSSLAPCRPAEYMTVSAGIFFPLSSVAMAPSGRASTEDTVSPNRKVTARSRRWYLSASTTSTSQNSSIRSRCSTTVTLVPRAANMDAYSIPITPAPATTIERGTVCQVDDPVGVDDGALVELDAGRPGGPGAGGDHDLVRGGPADPAVAAVDLHRVRVEEAARAGHGRDPVTGQLAAHHVHLPADHVAGAGGQVGDGDLVLDPVALPVHLPLVEAGQVEDRLAQRLGRDRARVQAHAADHVLALDDRHPAVELRRGDGGLLAAGPRADHQHVVVVHVIQCDDLRAPFEPLDR